jgi:hypothetical protein
VSIVYQNRPRRNMVRTLEKEQRERSLGYGAFQSLSIAES